MTALRFRILFVTIADLPEGWGRTARLKTLVGALTDLGHQVQIWNQHALESAGALEPKGRVAGAEFEYVLGTTARQYGFKVTQDKLRAVRLICSRLKTEHSKAPVDFVVFNHLAFYDTYPITRLCRKLGIRTVQCYEDERQELVSSHQVGLAQRLFGLNSWMADRWCSGMADAIFVISSYLQEKYSRLSGCPERVHIVPTIVRCSDWDFGLPPETDIPLIFYSGGFGEHEEVEKLVDALGLLKAGGNEFRMLFLGANPKLPRVVALRTRLAELGLERHVELRGFSPSAVVKQEMAGAHILMNLRTNSLWSRSGLSTKLSEYLASGRLVVTTDIGDNARYVKHEESALVVSPDIDAPALAEVLERALKNRDLRLRLGKGGQAAARAHFDTPVVQTRVQAILESLVPR